MTRRPRPDTRRRDLVGVESGETEKGRLEADMDSAVRRAFSTRRRGLSAPSGVDDVDAVPYLPWKKRVFGIGPEHPVCFVPGTAPASKLSALRA